MEKKLKGKEREKIKHKMFMIERLETNLVILVASILSILMIWAMLLLMTKNVASTIDFCEYDNWKGSEIGWPAPFQEEEIIIKCNKAEVETDAIIALTKVIWFWKEWKI